MTTLRQRCNTDLAERVLFFKETVRDWLYFICLKYMQSHELTDNEESFLESVTDYYISSLNEIEGSETFLKSLKLPTLDLSYVKKKKAKQ